MNHSSKSDLYVHKKTYIGDKHSENSSQQHDSEILGEFVECSERIKTEVKEEPLDDDEFDETLHYAFSTDIKTEIKEEDIEEDVIGNTLPYYSTDLNIKEEMSERIDTSGNKTEKRHSCEICFKSFNKPSQVQRHMRTHTGEKPYQCTLCEKWFSQKGSLTKHMITHTGEKPHKCSLCEKSFSDKYDMKKHMKTHTGEKPFMCSICSRCFAERKTLKRHMNTHTTIKPNTNILVPRGKYNCSECGQIFSNKLDFYDHMKTYHGEKHYDLFEKSSQQHESTFKSPGEFGECNEVINREVEEESLEEDEIDTTLPCYSTSMNEYNVFGENLRKTKMLQPQESTSEEIEMKSDKYGLEDLSCDQCGKFFKDIGMLTVHKWIHN